MTYSETIDFLFNQVTSFQQVGAAAYKPGLERVEEFCRLLGNPHNDYHTIHIAGTNGKGSTSHMMASVLQQAGYQVGLSTSPHLNDFRERIQKENIPEEMKDVLLKPTTDSITFLNHSDNGDFDIPLRWQSKGTQKYIRILEALYNMITSPHVYFLDELGEDLHNDLLFYYLNVFIFNSDKSQLIITSQETTLLSQDLINENRGVVWFVEKNRETASSEYARGDSFGLHKNLSLYNSYRIGRLGAKPELGSIFINLED